MGLMLCPAGDDVTSPDVSWSHYGFNLFRQWLAQTEGFALPEMVGFGGSARGAASPPRWHRYSTIQTTTATSHPLNARPCSHG